MDMHDPRLLQIGRRRDSRLRLAIPATLETLEGKQRAMLSDLSQSGAHVQIDDPVAANGDGVLRWLHFEVFGRIVWTAPGQAGIEFETMLAPGTLITTRDIADFKLGPDEKREVWEAARAWSIGYR